MPGYLHQLSDCRGRVSKGVGTPCPCLKPQCAVGREFDPGPGQYSRMSFSSDPCDWYGVLICTCLSFQILNLLRTLSSWGSGNYRPYAPFLYEVASHVKQLPFGPLLHEQSIQLQIGHNIIQRTRLSASVE